MNGGTFGWLYRPRQDGWTDVIIALVIALGYLCLLGSTLGELGYARDEGFYFQAASAYQAWFELWWADPPAALEAVDSYWRINSEHPALIKSLFALSHALLWDRWQLVSMEGTSFRFPGMLLSSLGVGLVYLWGARARGRLVGVVAALSLGGMPRFFFHAHLACFDAPVVTMWTLAAYCYWRAVARGGIWRALATGACFALALDTKHNSWFLPIVCGLHALLVQLPHEAGGPDRRAIRRRALGALAAMATMGPLLLVAGWPWLWAAPFARFAAYAKFHLHHVYYNMEFLGQNYWQPPMPRAYAFVMTAATVPVVTLVAFGIGLGWTVRRDIVPLVSRRSRPPGRGVRHSVTLLWILAIAVQYAAWLSPTTPIFGGTKHWMTAYPFVALFAGEGARLTLLVARRWWKSRSAVGVRRGMLEALWAAALVLPPMVQALRVHPWGLSSYNVLVGGASGAANLGLNRGFWGYTTGSVASYLNREAPRGARVQMHDTAPQAWDMLVRDGRVRGDLMPVWSIAEADVALYHHEKHMAGQEHQIWQLFGTVAPVHIAGLDGVPVVWIYQRPAASDPRASAPTSQRSAPPVKP